MKASSIMKHQVICNEYTSVKDLENGIQYYLNLYGNDAKVVVEVAPITNVKSFGTYNGSSPINTETSFLLTLLIFEKTKFNGDQRE